MRNADINSGLNETSPGARELKVWVNLANMGLAAGCLAGNQDAAIWYKEAQEGLREAHEEKKDTRPPKPPSRPNARIGGLALEHGF